MSEPPPPAPPKSRLTSTFLPLAGVAVLVFLGVVMWLTDFITLQGERTIYTARCEAGAWAGARCTGKLQAGPRYRFRALRIHEEVLFWTPGARERSGKFTECDVQDGRNWTCPRAPAAAGTITLKMEHGRAVHDASGAAQPFQAIEKWRWLLLSWGLYAGDTADY